MEVVLHIIRRVGRWCRKAKTVVSKGKEEPVMSGDNEAKRALVVEGDEAFRERLVGWVEELGWTVEAFGDGMEAIAYLGASQVYWRDDGWPDVVIADVDMPAYSGLDLLTAMRASRERVPTMLILNCEDGDVEREARQLGAAGVLCKPFDKATFQRRVMSCAGRPVVRTTPIGNY